MGFEIPENVWETTITEGTGDLDLQGNVAGYHEFSTQLSNGDTTLYAIRQALLGGAVHLEVGVGTFTSGSPDKLARTTVLYSTAGGAKIDLPAGTKDVIAGIPGMLVSDLVNPAAGNGILTQLGVGAFNRVTITAGTGIAVTNGDGVSGNPTVAVDLAYRVRGYVNFTGGVSPSVQDGLDVGSVSQSATGVYVVTWNTDIGSNPTVVVSAQSASALFANVGNNTGDSTTVRVWNASGALTDPAAVHVVRFQNPS